MAANEACPKVNEPLKTKVRPPIQQMIHHLLHILQLDFIYFIANIFGIISLSTLSFNLSALSISNLALVN